MADVQITPQAASFTEAAPTFTTLNATDTYYVPRSAGQLVLWFENTNASAATITFDATQTVGGLALTDPTKTIPATTGKRIIGNFPEILEVDDATSNDGKLKFSCSAATGCTVAAVIV